MYTVKCNGFAEDFYKFKTIDNAKKFIKDVELSKYQNGCIHAGCDYTIHDEDGSQVTKFCAEITVKLTECPNFPSNLTPFGLFVRRYRLEHNMLQKHMATAHAEVFTKYLKKQGKRI